MINQSMLTTVYDHIEEDERECIKSVLLDVRGGRVILTGTYRGWNGYDYDEEEVCREQEARVMSCQR